MTERTLLQTQIILFNETNSMLLINSQNNRFFFSGNVNPLCHLNKGDLVTIEHTGPKLVSVTSATCRNCPHNEQCKSYDPDLEIIPIPQSTQTS